MDTFYEQKVKKKFLDTILNIMGNKKYIYYNEERGSQNVPIKSIII
jgi:hypothetical protein